MIHSFSATCLLRNGVSPMDHRGGKRWSIHYNTETRVASVDFKAVCPASALMRLHFIMQRLARGKKQGKLPGCYYLAADYVLQSMRSENGSYDLPRGGNPDFSSVESRRAFMDREKERISERCL